MDGKRTAEDSHLSSKRCKVKEDHLNLVYPFLKRPKHTITPPFINVGQGLDISDLTLQLQIGEGLFFNDLGQLAVVGAHNFKTQVPLTYKEGTLHLNFHEPLFLNDDGNLTIAVPKYPLYESEKKELCLALSDGLTIYPGKGLGLALDPVFKFADDKYFLQCGAPLDKVNGSLVLQTGNGVEVQNNRLECTLNFQSPLQREGSAVNLQLGYGLDKEDNKLVPKVKYPLSVSWEGIKLDCVKPLIANIDSISLQYDSYTLKTTAAGLEVNLGSGLKAEDPNGIIVSCIRPVYLTDRGVALDYERYGFEENENHQLSLRLNPQGGLVVTKEGLGLSPAILQQFTNTMSRGNVLSILKTRTGNVVNYKFTESGGVGFLTLGNFNREGCNQLKFEREEFIRPDGDLTCVIVPLAVQGKKLNFPVACTPATVELTDGAAIVKKPVIISAYSVSDKPTPELHLKIETAKALAGGKPLAGVLSALSILTVPQFNAIL
ncbi:fiber [Siadenovirus carbocapituli]|uniref:Fiber n=1 Tax=Siadenovirus sp. TaxID=2671519 RepID=A0A9E7QZB9_9ADEN|nr:fiber [Siadenovirus sp.]